MRSTQDLFGEIMDVLLRFVAVETAPGAAYAHPCVLNDVGLCLVPTVCFAQEGLARLTVPARSAGDWVSVSVLLVDADKRVTYDKRALRV